MNARQLLCDLEEHGVLLQADGTGTRLVVDAPVGVVTADIVEQLGTHKSEILSLLAGQWGAADWIDLYEERCAIAEHDGGLSRAEAAASAYQSCVIAWMNSNPAPANDPDRCAHCDEAMDDNEALPFLLNGAGGHVWMHDTCHAAWMECYRADARDALAEFGLPSA